MSIYEEIEIEDMDFDEDTLVYTYPCPCGDKFRITLEELLEGEDIAKCPSCTLRIMVIYEMEDLPILVHDDDSSEKEADGENTDTTSIAAELNSCTLNA
jgi:diphthamide biosynthesis protein 3